MSQFLTEIAVDVERVKRLLPRESFVESVTWNATTQAVEVVWSNRNCVTPYTVATPFSVQMLQDQQLPKCAKLVEHAKPAEQPINNVTEKVIDSRRRRVKSQLP